VRPLKIGRLDGPSRGFVAAVDEQHELLERRSLVSDDPTVTLTALVICRFISPFRTREAPVISSKGFAESLNSSWAT
jgi:hypothetical protein